jgi:hypothetical protein
MVLTSLAGAAIRDGGIDPANLGKGDWIYSMTDATNRLGGHINGVTNETSLMLFYKSQGIRYFIVKAATSDVLFNGCYGSPQFTSALVDIAHANGLLIFGYNRSYGSNVLGEISVSDYIFNQGADGFVWDAESEWENTSPWIGNNGPALAWQLCSGVRSNWPNKFLVHAPFPIISFHSSFPYKEFGYFSDTVMPQVYHSGWTGVKGTASGGINWSDVNWASWQRSLVGSNSIVNGTMIFWTNSIKPLALLENVYGGGGSSPCEGGTSAQNFKDVMEFMDYVAADPHAVTSGGYKGANFWRADLHGATQWGYIKAGTSGNFTGAVNNIVIDDPRAVTVGGWSPVRTFYNGSFYGNGSGVDTNSFGTNYLTHAQGTGANYVQFTPNIAVPGDYDLYEWHPYRAEASAGVPFIINYNGGSSTIFANQQTNTGNWSLLGRFNFLAGTSGTVRITDAIAEPTGIAIADGLKLVFVPPTSLPEAPGGLSASAISTSQISLSWFDNATNETGFVVGRSLALGGPYADVGTVAGGITNYTDDGLVSNTTYYYQVRATNFLGASTSSAPASATTQGSPAPPSITSQPHDVAVAAGQDASFSVTASGSPAPTYQWWFNNAPLSGAISAGYTKTNAQLSHAGTYLVIVTNSLGAVTSAPATLTVGYSLTTTAGTGGTITRNSDQSVYPAGSTVTLTANPNNGYAFLGWSGDAGGSGNPLDFVLNTNASVTANFVSTATEIILDNPDPGVSFNGSWSTGNTAAGRYGADYRFASTAAGGLLNAVYRPYIYTPGHYDVYLWYSQGSNRATNAPWSIYCQSGSITVSVNQQINGGGWLRVGVALPFGQGTNGYVQLSNDTGYSGSVVIADAVRFLYASALTPPAITTQPRNRAAAPGGSASFSVSASSPLPLRYQWRRNGLNIVGQTAATLTIGNVQNINFAAYTVLVSNDDGSVLSQSATLTSAVQPTILSSANTGTNFMVTFTTEFGPVYNVEFKNDLDDSLWQSLSTGLDGTGSPVSIFDNSLTNFMRFYRIHVQ